MKHLFKAHVVLKQLRESKYHALCKTAHKLWIDIQWWHVTLQIAFISRTVGNLELTWTEIIAGKCFYVSEGSAKEVSELLPPTLLLYVGKWIGCYYLKVPWLGVVNSDGRSKKNYHPPQGCQGCHNRRMGNSIVLGLRWNESQSKIKLNLSVLLVENTAHFWMCLEFSASKGCIIKLPQKIAWHLWFVMIKYNPTKEDTRETGLTAKRRWLR